jgi:GrpB-like predicted nucleotidyltransferase (UPF0157 family)
MGFLPPEENKATTENAASFACLPAFQHVGSTAVPHYSAFHATMQA